MLFLLVLCECGTGEGGGDGRNFAAGYGRPVRVSAAAGIPGCFVVGGERYGYFCELMEAYAENGDGNSILPQGCLRPVCGTISEAV